MKEEYFDEHGWLKKEYLWPLRKEITLGSIYVDEYNNSFGISAEKVCDFFTSFVESYCESLAQEDGLWDQALEIVKEQLANDPNASEQKIQNHREFEYIRLQYDKYDNPETLLDWYYCFTDNPLSPTYINVDIHWDFARSIKVIATSESEATDIVEQMMEKGEIPAHTFEPTGDYELETDWQPDN